MLPYNIQWWGWSLQSLLLPLPSSILLFWKFPYIFILNAFLWSVFMQSSITLYPTFSWAAFIYLNCGLISISAMQGILSFCLRSMVRFIACGNPGYTMLADLATRVMVAYPKLLNSLCCMQSHCSFGLPFAVARLGVSCKECACIAVVCTEVWGGGLYLILIIISTVEPLTNDHPHQRPSLSYDHISCDGLLVVSVRIRIPHERPSLLYDHTNVILRVVV